MKPVRQEQLEVFGRRTLADMLDIIIASPIMIFLGIIATAKTKSSDYGFLWALAGYVGYLVLSNLIWKTTLGKRICGLEILELLDYNSGMGPLFLRIRPLPERLVNRCPRGALCLPLPVGKFIYTGDGIRWFTKNPNSIILALRELIKVFVMLIPFGFVIFLAGGFDLRKQTLYDRAFGMIIVKR